MMEIKVTGDINFKIPDIARSTKMGIRHGFYELGKHLVKDTVRDIKRKGRTGKRYIYKSRIHVASVRGEAPANMSGNLAKSVDFYVQGSNKMEFGYDDSVDYGKDLETIRDRPALLLNIKKNEATAINVFKNNVRKYLNVK